MSNTAASIETGFPPIIGAGAKVLILGSMPGVQSLDAHQYYAHPRNAFWWIMGQLFGAGPDKLYRLRQQILIERGIAVWDVIFQCRRPGSLDSAIETGSVVVNDFAGLLRRNPQIGGIFFNGKTAESFFRRYVIRAGICAAEGMLLQTLPSTSPANARLRPEQKLGQWRQKLGNVLAIPKSAG